MASWVALLGPMLLWVLLLPLLHCAGAAPINDTQGAGGRRTSSHMAWAENERGFHVAPPTRLAQSGGKGNSPGLGRRALNDLGVGVDPCQGPLNPCGSGMCSPVGTSFTCTCPSDTFMATRVDGTVTCTKSLVQDCVEGYTTREQDSCGSFADSLTISVEEFSGFNPGLNCSLEVLPEGLQVCISPRGAPGATPYNITTDCSQISYFKAGDSCASVASAANLSTDQLLDLNPGLLCQATYLLVGQPVCTGPAPPPKPQKGTADCGCAYTGEQVCGSDGRTYPGFCVAQCSFASPVTRGPCPKCVADCKGYVGEMPPGCNRLCQWPEFSDSKLKVAKAQFPTRPYPLCAWHRNQCSTMCNDKKMRFSPKIREDVYDTCYARCHGADRAPCWGPWVDLKVGYNKFCPRYPTKYCNGKTWSEPNGLIFWAKPNRAAFLDYMDLNAK